MSYQAIIFDLDDTLYPEISYVFSGYHAIGLFAQQQWGLEARQTENQLRELFANGNRSRTLDAWLQANNLSQQWTAKLIDVYRQHTPKLELFAGVHALLAATSQSRRLGLISDGYLEVQKRKFAALSIGHFFDNVIFTDQWGREYWKPHQRSYRESLELLEVKSASEAIYVGDNPAKDFITARQLGMSTVCVRLSDSPIHPNSAPSTAHQADFYATSIEELTAFLMN